MAGEVYRLLCGGFDDRGGIFIPVVMTIFGDG